MYLIQIPVAINLIGMAFVFIVRQHRTSNWQYIYFIFQTLPTVFTFYLTKIIFSIFIPIIGRSGAGSNPELLIGMVALFMTLLITSFFVSICFKIKLYFTVIFYLIIMFQIPLIITIGRRPIIVIYTLLAIFTLFFIFIFTPLGFPYSENFNHPAPQRYTVYVSTKLFYFPPNFTGICYSMLAVQ